MSTLKTHPPQTYSRLFRPWDTSRNAISHANARSAMNAIVKTECCTINSERECSSSSNSSSRSGLDDGPNSIFQRKLSQVHSPTCMPGNSSPQLASAAFTAPGLYDALEHHHQMQIMAGLPPAPELYYAAAAAAAASSITAPSSSAAAFGMDPYTIGLMEQEYARVMAEDAQLKAINARKQRPKKFKCPHCEVAFSNNGQLKGHIRIHTGERPFKCDVESCGKTFTRNEELTRHKRIHTGLRPYPCTACGKKFGRRDHLKKHMKTHMPQERQLGPIFVPMYPYLYGY